ncbi:MAG: sodium:proton antiporter [Syntrophales bacterium]
MSPRSKREDRGTVHLRDKNATRSEKTAILDEFCATRGCDRKHAISVLKGYKPFTKYRAKPGGTHTSTRIPSFHWCLSPLIPWRRHPCSGNLHGTPSVNTILLTIGTILASWMSTAGVAMLSDEALRSCAALHSFFFTLAFA